VGRENPDLAAHSITGEHHRRFACRAAAGATNGRHICLCPVRWHVTIATLVTGAIGIAIAVRASPPHLPVGPGPGPACALPLRGCSGPPEWCAELVEMPTVGQGYIDVRIAGEDRPETSTSYLRRDLILVVRYAAAKVACKAGDWHTGTGGEIVLGDMSERDGSTPGTASSRPRHPANTHQDGRDIDIAYFQRDTLDNQLRSICRHTSVAGVDEYRCLAAPDHLDASRTALFLGAVLESTEIRVIGVDGRAARPILAAFDRLCTTGWIARWACDQRAKIHFELRSTGKGWFRGHHNHLHISWRT
jgi:hypothetical protein